ncbi:TPA: hypothetical protein I7181_22885 [Vibrio vulnificus]|nr:hypothetical protein [Vibrio vulnificus]HAT8488928.1 hypothetical protein [Vibrio vulnificus]HAT8516493.1 hypothetical protein [Vibrio vulnificus]
MSFSEHEVQKELWKKKDTWGQLIQPINYPKLVPLTSNSTATEIIQHYYYEQLKSYEKTIRKTKLVGCEVSLKKENSSTIRTDFIAASSSENGIHIIELKKSAQTERQAFTELLGYSSHFNAKFKVFGKQDIGLIVIAPMVERIVQESVVQTLVYENKLVFALSYEFSDPSDISTIYLKAWLPSANDIADFTSNTFRNDCISTVSFVWRKNNHTGLESKEVLNNIVAHISQCFESKGVNGFALSLNYNQNMAYPNQICIGAINPYLTSKWDFYDDNPNKMYEEINGDWTQYQPTLADVIPTLNNKSVSVHQNSNYMEFLESSWLEKLQSDVKNIISDLVDAHKVTIGGYYNLDQLKSSEDYRLSTVNNIRTSGLIRNIYWEYLKKNHEDNVLEKSVDFECFYGFYSQLK